MMPWAYSLGNLGSLDRVGIAHRKRSKNLEASH